MFLYAFGKEMYLFNSDNKKRVYLEMKCVCTKPHFILGYTLVREYVPTHYLNLHLQLFKRTLQLQYVRIEQRAFHQPLSR